MWPVSANMKQELRKPVHTISIKAIVLDTNFHAVEAGEFFDQKSDQIQNYIIDGNVDIDTLRGTRRTAEITLQNVSEDFVPNSEWTGKFYLNRAIRLFRGVQFSDETAEYAPIGTFLVDNAEVIVERNMVSVVLSLSDMWKKLTKSQFLIHGSMDEGTHINAIIRNIVGDSGADRPLAPNIDPLTGGTRDSSNTTLGRKLTYERGDNRGDFLKTLCSRFGIDIYFDVNGRLTTNDRTDHKDKEAVWDFTDASDGTGMLISIRRAFNDDNLYNHIFAVGSGDPKNIVNFEIQDDNPDSVTSVNKIGDRLLLIENSHIKEQSKIREAAQLAWHKRFDISEEINLGVLCNPALEGDDVINIKVAAAKVNDKYRIQHMNVPLGTSNQGIKCVNIIRG